MSDRCAVFLDRDGVLNRKPAEGDYVKCPEELHLLPGAGSAVARLNEAGAAVILVTNQRGIGRGVMSEEDYARVHAALCCRLHSHGAHLDAEYHCPDTATSSPCRKPHTGLFLAAVKDNPCIQLRASWVVGDAPADVAAGRALGCRTVLIAHTNRCGADYVAPRLAAAVDIVLGELGRVPPDGSTGERP
jgi:D-glycero-D-manno-heptose 1,7-bisphosphate phosphatase